MFYGTSFFKKSTASPQIKNDLPNHVTQGNTGSAKNALWDVICDSDLNSSSDLDDSMEYFYSRSSLFKNRSDANESKLSSTSGPQKWKSKFFNEPPRESPKVNQSMDSIEDCEPAPSSPALKFTIGQAKPGGFQKMSSFGQSPVYKSPVVTTSSGRAEKDFSLRDFSTRKSPSLQKKTDDENLAEPELTVYEEDDEGEKEEAPQASNEIVEERKIPSPTPSGDRASDSIGLERLPLLQLKLKNEAIKLENWKNELVSNLQKKEAELTEANDLVERLRKSNLELQMDRENASLKLKDEVEQREATEKKVSGTRDLCELIKTQIELTRSTCTSTMQTCFKTRTVQKALESLLTTTFEDLQELRSLLTQKGEENNTLALRLEEAKNKHHIELEKSNSEKLAMTQKLQEMQSMQNDYERDIQEQTSILANTLQSIRLCNEQYEQLVYRDVQLREAFHDAINIKEETLVKAEIKSSEKDIRIEEAHRKCSQLTDDLRHVYELLQASKRENTERTQTISCLQEKVSKLELEKGHLEEMVNKLEVEHLNTKTIYEEAMQSLKSKTADSLLALILMVSESNELMKSYEQSEVNLKMCLMKTELEIETLKCREKDLSQRIMEMKNEEFAKSQKINELSTVLENCKNENEKLRMEADNGAKALKELDEAYKTLDCTLMQTLQKQEELKENYATLESRCQEQDNTLAKKNIKAAEQASYVDKLVKQVESLEKEGAQLKAKLQDSKKYAEFKNTKVEELESQLQERLRQLEELRETVRMNDAEKAEMQKSARENLASVASKEAENAQLTERLQLADAERMAAIKRNDEIRAELLYAMEQQQQEMDKLLRLKDRELENLRSTLATQQNDSEKNVKKTEKKIAESGTQIEKLTKQLKECTQEKKELSKQLNMKTQRMNKLEKENEQKANKLQENTDTIASLREELDSLRLNKDQLDEKVSAQERELQKLKKMELEFESFKHQVINNSPPASTQLPAEIETLVQQTPKSPLLSQKLTHLNLLKTPQKTPKGILKQPGSECKRRRVLLVSPERSPASPPRVEPVDYGLVDLDSEPEPQSRPITPKIRRTPIVGGKLSSQTRNSNLRKTPGAKTKGPAEGKRRQEVSAEGASWFDSDPIFGLANED